MNPLTILCILVDQSAALGFDAYQIVLFTGNVTNFPPFYMIQSNLTSSAMLTIINEKYSNENCYEFQFLNPQIVSFY